MKRLYRYIMPALLPAALLLPGCTADDDLVLTTPDGGATLPGETAGIYVTGSGLGQPSAPATRYVPPTGEAGPGHDTQPGDHNDGICRATEVMAFLFTATSNSSWQWPDDKDYAYEGIATCPLYTSGRDRYSEFTFANTIPENTEYKYLRATAMAYTESDKSKFSVANGATLTLTDPTAVDATPELYFGEVRGRKPADDPPAKDGEFDLDHNTFWWNNINDNDWSIGGFHRDAYTCNIGLEGRIFRAVSRFDLSLTDIPTNVEGLDLLVTNVPKVMGLSGSHGTYYPVTAVTDKANVAEGETVVASVDLADGQDEATLSAFFLPSEVGMQMKLRVRMRQDREADELADDSQLEEGKDYRDFDLLPPKSYFLTGADAAVYNVGSGLKAEDGSGNLYVYDNRRGYNCFYSYANVLVTMHGKFENVAAETTTVDVEIEVEPNFEHEGLGVDTNFDGEHHYQIK